MFSSLVTNWINTCAGHMVSSLGVTAVLAEIAVGNPSRQTGKAGRNRME